MRVIIDTCSLLSLVRYYLPFDKQFALFNFIKTKIKLGEIIIIDAVYNECEYFSKGIVLESLSYLKDKGFKKENNIPVNTEDIIAPSPAKFLRMVDNQFTIGVIKNNLDNSEYEQQKGEFMESADMKMILYLLNLKSNTTAPLLFDSDIDDRVVIVTEETSSANDGKPFHKIPVICKILNIPTMTLPQLLAEYDIIDILFK